MENEDDLTRIYYLGRSKRDVINEDLKVIKAADKSAAENVTTLFGSSIMISPVAGLLPRVYAFL